MNSHCRMSQPLSGRGGSHVRRPFRSLSASTRPPHTWPLLVSLLRRLAIAVVEKGSRGQSAVSSTSRRGRGDLTRELVWLVRPSSQHWRWEREGTPVLDCEGSPEGIILKAAKIRTSHAMLLLSVPYCRLVRERSSSAVSISVGADCYSGGRVYVRLSAVIASWMALILSWLG